MDCPRKATDIDENFWIRSSVEVRNDTESAKIIVEESLIFQAYITFSVDFQLELTDAVRVKTVKLTMFNTEAIWL